MFLRDSATVWAPFWLLYAETLTLECHKQALCVPGASVMKRWGCGKERGRVERCGVALLLWTPAEWEVSWRAVFLHREVQSVGAQNKDALLFVWSLSECPVIEQLIRPQSDLFAAWPSVVIRTIQCSHVHRSCDLGDTRASAPVQVFWLISCCLAVLTLMFTCNRNLTICACVRVCLCCVARNCT